MKRQSGDCRNKRGKRPRASARGSFLPYFLDYPRDPNPFRPLGRGVGRVRYVFPGRDKYTLVFGNCRSWLGEKRGRDSRQVDVNKL